MCASSEMASCADWGIRPRGGVRFFGGSGEEDGGGGGEGGGEEGRGPVHHSQPGRGQCGGSPPQRSRT